MKHCQWYNKMLTQWCNEMMKGFYIICLPSPIFHIDCLFVCVSYMFVCLFVCLTLFVSPLLDLLCKLTICEVSAADNSPHVFACAPLQIIIIIIVVIIIIITITIMLIMIIHNLFTSMLYFSLALLLSSILCVKLFLEFFLGVVLLEWIAWDELSKLI